MSRKAEYYEFDSFPRSYNALHLEAREDIRRIGRDRGWMALPRIKSVLFVQRGNYTYAEDSIESPHQIGQPVGVGFAKSRPTDKYDENIGRRIAMRRAIEDAVSG